MDKKAYTTYTWLEKEKKWVYILCVKKFQTPFTWMVKKKTTNSKLKANKQNLKKDFILKQIKLNNRWYKFDT